MGKKSQKEHASPTQGNDRDQMSSRRRIRRRTVNTYYSDYLPTPKTRPTEKLPISSNFLHNQDGRGTHANISGGGVGANADNVSGAKKFLEFLASDEAQSIFPTESAEYPAVPSIEWSPMQKAGANLRRTTPLYHGSASSMRKDTLL